ncbi:GGDEF domain-containing protein [Vibrio scophthalmi]|uniref:GGDEF domain-containing protein n=1 Tax=Vibrio scophthalmi TaxID=45658 RepID=UPI002284A65C|nr:GGDEF domain-containing protein [Vibrio scophthalmi]MCY9804584.1 GGDEF domain-containing protein [Vibrio scophthalmi]
MTNKNKTKRFSTLQARLKGMLLALSALLILANLYVFSETRQLARSYSEQQNQATWFLFQLSKEFSSLVSVTPFALENDQYRQKAELSYELTWSRFDLLLNAKEADSFMQLTGAREFFSALFQRYISLEPELWKLTSKRQAMVLTNQLESIYQDMITYVNVNFRIKSPIYQQQMDQARLLNQTQWFLMSLLFICALLVGYILHLESNYNKHLALTDALTKIKNRLAMTEDVNRQIESQTHFTVCLLDLNGFKQINDQYGHHAGDIALQTLAKRFENVECHCRAYRMGGDEFALILPQQRQEEMEQTLEAILSCFDEKITLSLETSVQLSASLGLASYPAQGSNFSELLKTADSNMYQMKFATQKRSIQL